MQTKLFKLIIQDTILEMSFILIIYNEICIVCSNKYLNKKIQQKTTWYFNTPSAFTISFYVRKRNSEKWN